MARRKARKGATRLSTRLSRRRATRSKTTPRSPRASRKSTPAPARLVSLPPGPFVDEPFSIPTGYGDTRVILMVKDPWWLYAYWEVQPQTERAIRGQLLPEEVPGLQSILRVYDVTDRAASRGAVRLGVQLMASSSPGRATSSARASATQRPSAPTVFQRRGSLTRVRSRAPLWALLTH